MSFYQNNNNNNESSLLQYELPKPQATMVVDQSHSLSFRELFSLIANMTDNSEHLFL